MTTITIFYITFLFISGLYFFIIILINLGVFRLKKSSNLQISTSSNLQISTSSNLQIPTSSNPQIFKFSNLQILKSSNPQISKFSNFQIAIIIPARNEEENIGSCLTDIANQDYPSHLLEVVVIDDQSQDQTAARVVEFARSHPSLNLRLIPLKPDGEGQAFKKQALRTGVEATSGDLIIVTDADTRHMPGWVSAIVNFYEQQKPKMIIGPVVFCDEETLFERLQSLEFIGLMAATAGSCRMGFPLMCNGANLAFERAAYLATLDSSDLRYPSGDDLFLMMKIGKMYGARSIKYLFADDAIVSTHAKRSLREFISQRLRWVSKSRGYTDPVVKAVAAVTWLFNFLLLSALVAGIFHLQILILSLVLLGIKMVLEFPAVLRFLHFFGKMKMGILFPLAQLLNLVYVSLIGIFGNIVSYEWKGRRVTPLKRNARGLPRHRGGRRGV